MAAGIVFIRLVLRRWHKGGRAGSGPLTDADSLARCHTAIVRGHVNTLGTIVILFIDRRLL